MSKNLQQLVTNVHRLLFIIKWYINKQNEEQLIPTQTGNETLKLYTNCKVNLSIDSWPPKTKET